MAIAMAHPPRVSIKGLARLDTRAILLASCSTAATFRSKRSRVAPRAHLFALGPNRRDIPVETLAHGVFEGEGLHDADSLQRLLQGFDDACPAVKLGAGARINAPDPLAKN